MSSDPLPPQPLRLSIAHLMLWTLGTAIALGLFRPFLEAQTPSGSASAERYFAAQRALSFILIPFGGASIGALLLALIHLVRRDRRFPAQPGHWLLIVIGVSYLSYALLRLLLLTLDLNDWLRWGYAALALVMAGVYLLPLLLVRDSPRWTICFAAGFLRRLTVVPAQVLFAFVLQSSGASSRIGVIQIASALMSLPMLIAGIVVLIVLLREVILRPQRDYLHWTGCASQVAIGTVALAQYLSPWLLAWG